MFSLSRSLAAVTLAAEHLAVIGNSCTAIFPWSDVVGFHFFQFVVLAAVYTDSALSFIGFSLLFLVKGAEREVTKVATEHITVDA